MTDQQPKVLDFRAIDKSQLDELRRTLEQHKLTVSGPVLMSVQMWADLCAYNFSVDNDRLVRLEVYRGLIAGLPGLEQDEPIQLDVVEERVVRAHSRDGRVIVQDLDAEHPTIAFI